MQVKYDAILAVQLGNLTKTAIAAKYDVSASTLSGRLSRKDCIKSAFESSTFSPSRKRMRTALHPDIEESLITCLFYRLLPNKSLAEKNVSEANINIIYVQSLFSSLL